jgi:hypothetical protein
MIRMGILATPLTDRISAMRLSTNTKLIREVALNEARMPCAGSNNCTSSRASVSQMISAINRAGWNVAQTSRLGTTWPGISVRSITTLSLLPSLMRTSVVVGAIGDTRLSKRACTMSLLDASALRRCAIPSVSIYRGSGSRPVCKRRANPDLPTNESPHNS